MAFFKVRLTKITSSAQFELQNALEIKTLSHRQKIDILMSVFPKQKRKKLGSISISNFIALRNK